MRRSNHPHAPRARAHDVTRRSSTALRVAVWIALALLVACCTEQEAREVQDTQSIDDEGDPTDVWTALGEEWDPAGRLPDFSYAGYRTGSVPLPAITSQVNVESYGAFGDDDVDDTAAIQAAIDGVAAGQVIWIPDGRYIVSDRLIISRSNVVLRGESEDGARLAFQRSLTDLLGPESRDLDFPNVGPGEGKRWAFIGGLVWVEGADPIDASTLLASVVDVASRGDHELEVDDASTLAVGDWIRVVMQDPPSGDDEGSLLAHVHDDLTATGSETGWRLFEFATRIEAIEGDRITLERPLPLDVQLEWSPEIHPFAPTVQEVGIETLTLELPDIAPGTHLYEVGFNGIYFYRVANSWVRDVTILNADSGIFLNFSTFNTVEGLTLEASPYRESRSGPSGHHGIGLGWLSADNLISEFDINTEFRHDITIETVTRSNVFSNGRGVDVNLDHHKKAPYQNLFTEIDLGAGTRAWESAGPSNGGPQSAAFNTYWNVRASGSFPLPKSNFGPRLNFVGLPVTGTPNSTLDWAVEGDGTGDVPPSNLYRAQLEWRLR